MTAPGFWGDEFLVNAVTHSAQMTPVIAALDGGRFAIAYTDYSRSSLDGFTDFSNSAIRVQVFHGDGSACTPVVQVNTVTMFNQKSPRIAALSDGGFVVTYADESIGWQTSGDDGWGDAVRLQRFDANGGRLGSETLANTTTIGDQSHPTVGLLDDGRFLVSWDDGLEVDDKDLNAQLFNADGTRDGAQFMLNDDADGWQTGSDIGALPGGGFVVTWVDGTGIDGDVGTIMARIFLPDGTPSDDAFQVNTTAAREQYQPGITVLAGGGFVIAWTDDSRGLETGGDDSSGYAIRAQVFSATGTPVGGEFRVNQATANGQVQPELLALSDGRFIIAFSDTSMGTETGGDDTEVGAIRARIFNADGTPSSAEFLVNTTTAGHQNEPQMAELPDGRVVFTWSDYSYGTETGGDDADNGAIRARILDLREEAAFWVGSTGRDEFTGTRWDDKLNGGRGSDVLAGADGDDRIFGKAGSDRLTGGAGFDALRGNNGHDSLDGGAGKDTLYGGGGNDLLEGGGGKDRIIGNRGHDTIIGGAGKDEMSGGEGADTFVFADPSESGPSKRARDVITDFRKGNDRIDLSAIDANPATPTDDEFRFLGQDSFTGHAGEIRYSKGSLRSMISIDIDGDRTADMRIELSGTHKLDHWDFIL